jgi:hypothetical protein
LVGSAITAVNVPPYSGLSAEAVVVGGAIVVMAAVVVGGEEVAVVVVDAGPQEARINSRTNAHDKNKHRHFLSNKYLL